MTPLLLLPIRTGKRPSYQHRAVIHSPRSGRMRVRCCVLLLLSLLVPGWTLLAQNRLPNNPASPVKKIPGFQGVAGKVLDGRTGKALPARIEIYDAGGALQDSYYQVIPGTFTNEDGSFRAALKPGKYTLKVSRGIDYLDQQLIFEVTERDGVEFNVYLKPWVVLRERGWLNGEGHAHLYTDQKPDREMLRGVRKICLAQGVDFICAAQGWAGAQDQTWRQDYQVVSDNHFCMYYGAEMPKYRTGHTWWLGLESTRNFFWSVMDTVYEKQYFQSPTATRWQYSGLGFPNFTEVELVPRLARAQNAVSIIAHPTRWWMQQRGAISKYTNNAVSNLAFSLLSGNLWDGLVVMGDQKDHYSYQNLWFNILNQGYRMPALAELDGGYNPESKYPYGWMRTYFYVGQSYADTLQAVVDAVRRGKTFVTTGPIVLSHVDSTYTIGDVIPSGATPHTLHLDAYASGEAEDLLSYVVVFRNGKIWQSWDLREQRIRHFQVDVPLTEREQAWYVIKAYGKRTWSNTDYLDVMARVEKLSSDEPTDRDVCITSPYYFAPQGTEPIAAMNTEVNLRIVSPVDKKPVKQGLVEVYHLGEKINTIPFKKGTARFSMPVNAIVKITSGSFPVVRRGLYMDFEPHRQLIERLSNGDWRERPAYRASVRPSYIPWEAFQLDETRQLLRRVDWEIELRPNERDKHWETFENLFTREKAD